MRVGLIALLLLVPLAGCLGGSDTDSQDLDPGPGVKTAPKASDGVNQEAGEDGSLTVELAADGSEGTAPLSINFTVTGSAEDNQGAAAEPEWNWRLFIEGSVALANGNELPATEEVTFEGAGTYVVIAKLSAPGYGTASANLTITVTDPVGGNNTGSEPLVMDHRCTPGRNSWAFNLGGAYNTCVLHTAEGPTTLVAQNAPSGCSVNAKVDQTYGEGYEFLASCEATMTSFPEVTITVQTEG